MNSTRTHHWMRIGVAAALFFLLLWTAGSSLVPAQHAFAAQAGEQLAMQTISKNATISARGAIGAEATAEGPYDKYIGLDSSMYVLAVAKASVKGQGVYVYKAQNTKTVLKTKKGKKRHFSKYNCMVVDTSKMKPGRKYKWLKVKMKGKARAYVLASQVKLRTLDTKTFGMSEKKLATKAGKKRLKACQYGLPYIGTPWRYSKNDMSKGINCYQYAHTCLTKAGVKMPKHSCSLGGLSRVGKAASLKKLRPGDILCYGTRKRGPTTHVALYIGDGLLINSSGAQGHDFPMGGIRISRLDYRSPGPLKARNVFGD